jgi:hypothetical protein
MHPHLVHRTQPPPPLLLLGPCLFRRAVSGAFGVFFVPAAVVPAVAAVKLWRERP